MEERPDDLRSLLGDLLDHYAALNMSEMTLQRLRSSLGLFLDYLENVRAVRSAAKLGVEDLRAYQKAVSDHVTPRGTPLKPSSVNSRVKAVKVLLRHAADRGALERGLDANIHYVREPRTLPTVVLDHRQVRAIAAAMPAEHPVDLRDRAVVELLYSTGVRIGELEKTDLGDLDLDTATLRVEGKGRKERIVPVGRTALRRLATYVRAGRKLLGPAPGERALLLNARGRRMSQSSMRQMIHRRAEAAGIEVNVTPHAFRRTCASEMIKADANLYHVKEILGHDTLDTLKRYVKLHIRDLRKTHQKCHPREKDPN